MAVGTGKIDVPGIQGVILDIGKFFMRDREIKIIFDLPSCPRNQKANPSPEGTICPISFVKDVLVSRALLPFLERRRVTHCGSSLHVWSILKKLSSI
jgi:hypothetical protein